MNAAIEPVAAIIIRMIPNTIAARITMQKCDLAKLLLLMFAPEIEWIIKKINPMKGIPYNTCSQKYCHAVKGRYSSEP